MGSTQLDPDVIGVIAEYLDEETLRAASREHPVFLAKWMRAQYETLSISKTDKRSKKFWEHIQSNAAAADLVKRVQIHSWLVQPRTQSHQSRTEILLNHVAAYFDPDYTRKKAEQRLQHRLTKDIQRVRKVLSGLHQVQSYTLEWNRSPEYHPELFVAFLNPVLTSWKSHLRELSLHLPIETYSTMVHIKLPALEKIRVCLDTVNVHPAAVNIHLDGLLVFLHNLKDTLTSFSLKSMPSSEGLDLSRLFRLMGTFPHLRSFALVIPFDGGHLAAIRPFTRFLTKHSRTLESLALTTTRFATHGKPIGPDCQYWIRSVINAMNPPFPRLKSVTLGLRPLRAPLDHLRNFLQLHAPTLQALCLVDRALSPQDIHHYIISPLTMGSPQSNVLLRRLEIRVDVLSPLLLRLLASSIPQLDTLRLDLQEFNRNPALFHRDLRTHDFDISRWTLRRLIMPPGPNSLWVRSLESVLMECIPSLQSIEVPSSHYH